MTAFICQERLLPDHEIDYLCEVVPQEIVRNQERIRPPLANPQLGGISAQCHGGTMNSVSFCLRVRMLRLAGFRPVYDVTHRRAEIRLCHALS